jgi:hypothetical protein
VGRKTILEDEDIIFASINKAQIPLAPFDGRLNAALFRG